MKTMLKALFIFLAFLTFASFVFYKLHSPYVLMIMLLPVFINGSLFGTIYGYLYALMSTLIVYFAFCEPYNSLVIKGSQQNIRIAVYCFLALFAVGLISRKIKLEKALQNALNKLTTTNEDLLWRVEQEVALKEQTQSALAENIKQELVLKEYLYGILNTIKTIDQLLISDKSSKEIIKESCNILSQHGGYSLAWIGYLVGDSIQIVAHSDDPTGYASWLKLSINPSDPTSIGPSAQSIIQNRIIVTQSLDVDYYAFWRDRATNAGLGSSICLPLKASLDKKPFGTLAIYAKNKSGFLMDEITMLENLAGDIGYALSARKKDLDIRENEERLRNIFENSMDALMLFSAYEGFIDCNRQTLKLFGFETKEEFLTYHPSDLSPKLQPNGEESCKAEIKHTDLAFLNGSDKFIWEHKRANGETFMADVLLTSFRLNGVDVIQSTVRDISEEIQKARKLQINKVILESLSEGVYAVDMNGICTYANKATYNILGYELEEIMGKNTHNLFHYKNPDGSAYHLQDCPLHISATTGKKYGEEEWLIKKDGNFIRVNISTAPFYDEDGKLMGGAMAFIDITDRYEYRRTSALLRKFFDNTDEGMTIADANGLITAVNPAFTKITGYTLSDVIGQNPRILQSGKQTEKFYENMWQHILENGRWQGEIENRRKNGETYNEWLTITSITNDKGDIEHFVAIFLDLTPLKLKQEEIDKQEKMILAQSRFAAMGEMIGMIAHQWRQPITAIGMSANNMQVDIELGDIDLEIFKKHIELIANQVQFLSHTIDDFRDFFRPDKEMGQVVVIDAIDASLKIIGKSLENNNIAVLKDITYNPTIMANESELMQAFLSIINNAKDILIERSIKPAFLTISTKQNFNFVEISICDNGGGVPEDIKQRIFEPYFTTKSAKNGTGLGLYIAKSIIEKHHKGTILVDNKNNGACFIIRLPIYERSVK